MNRLASQAKPRELNLALGQLQQRNAFAAKAKPRELNLALGQLQQTEEGSGTQSKIGWDCLQSIQNPKAASQFRVWGNTEIQMWASRA